MIDLHTWSTPNGRKISIALEEMRLAYKTHLIDLTKDEQYDPDFLKFSPNNKIPAIYDHDTNLSVFESGAILVYLAEKSGQFLPTNLPARVRTLEWLNWQTAGLGPILGQLNYFVNRADEKVPQAIRRFTEEASRLLGVLDKQLANNEYVADTYSIADIAIYPWSSPATIAIKTLTGQSFGYIEAWQEKLGSRSAVQTGMVTPPA